MSEKVKWEIHIRNANYPTLQRKWEYVAFRNGKFEFDSCKLRTLQECIAIAKEISKGINGKVIVENK